jgi:hypothetical protein
MNLWRARNRFPFARKGRRGSPRIRRLRFDVLEQRRMLAPVTVGNLLDVVNGNTQSIAELIANDGGDGISLREAILAANADTEADTISFAASLFAGGAGTILLENGELDIENSLTIQGSGAGLLTIDASGNDFTPTSTPFDINEFNDGDGSRVFNIDDGDDSTNSSVLLLDLTITGGDISDSGGAIRNAEDLSLDRCDIRFNYSLFEGGGIFNTFDGTVEVFASTIHVNWSEASGGGISSLGDVLIIDSTISENFAAEDGGGLNVFGDLRLEGSTISGNGAGGNGGGIQIPISSGNNLRIVNSTISGNTATLSGGGLYIDDLASPVVAEVSYSTIVGNSAAFGGGLFYDSLDDTLTVSNSIVADNTATTLAPDSVGARYFYSLLGDNTGSLVSPAPLGSPDANGNLVGTFGAAIGPLLGPLDDNGGPTLTHALLAGSPAINAGDPNAVAGVGDVPQFDQRGTGFSRVRAGGIDMGALETPPTVLVAQLSNEPGDATLSVTVDATGGFGSSAGSPRTDAFFNPVGSLGRLGAVFLSGVAYQNGPTGSREFLTNIAQNQSIIFQSTSRFVTSFTVGPFQFVLTQELVAFFNDGQRAGTRLVQTYQITNTASVSQQLELFRYQDGDLRWAGSLADTGGRQFMNFEEVLYARDTVDPSNVEATFVGISATGGQSVSVARYEIDRFSALKSRIESGGALRDSIVGDNDGDGVIESPSADIALAFRNFFELAAGETATYVTSTIFGAGSIDTVIVDPPERNRDPIIPPSDPPIEIDPPVEPDGPRREPDVDRVTPVFVAPVGDAGSGGGLPFVAPDAPGGPNVPVAVIALQNALSQPRVTQTEEIFDAVYALAEIEMVALVGYDMGDETVGRKKREEAGAASKDEPETVSPDEEEHLVEKPVIPANADSSSWEPLFWGALAGGGTLWLGGAWWWRGHRRQRRFSGEITG